MSTFLTLVSYQLLCQSPNNMSFSSLEMIHCFPHQFELSMDVQFYLCHFIWSLISVRDWKNIFCGFSNIMLDVTKVPFLFFILHVQICYFFYKNMAFGFTLFCFEAYASLSGQPAYNDWYMSFYNVFFTSLPVIALGVFDQDVPAHLCLKVCSLDY